jgi:hypothetical protein
MEFFADSKVQSKQKKETKKAENKEAAYKVTAAEDGFRYDYDDSSDLK